jgi:hypothetical protein
MFVERQTVEQKVTGLDERAAEADRILQESIAILAARRQSGDRNQGRH